jgi:hypothetical protein
MIGKRQSSRPMNNNVVVGEVRDSSSMVLSSYIKREKDCKTITKASSGLLRKKITKMMHYLYLDEHEKELSFLHMPPQV